MTAHLFETPEDAVERAARLLDPDAFDLDARLPWGDKRWAGRFGKRLQAVRQERARRTAQVALSAVFPELAAEVKREEVG